MTSLARQIAARRRISRASLTGSAARVIGAFWPDAMMRAQDEVSGAA